MRPEWVVQLNKDSCSMISPLQTCGIGLKQKITQYGLRNSLLVAPMLTVVDKSDVGLQ